MIESKQPLLIEESGDTSSQGMLFIPQIRPLAMKRPQLRPGLFTPRKCTAFIIIAVLLALTAARLIWGMKYMYTELHSISDSDGELVILPKKYSQSRGAYCLDGSAPGYYFRKGSQEGRDNWLIELMSGAWCYDMDDCYSRTFTLVGSSYVAPSTLPFNGLSSSNPKINPEFHNWNVVRFLYCDGASFSGNRSDPVQYKDRLLYMRGFPILTTLLDYLFETTHLKSAKNVLFTGYSAGGLGVFLHADYVRSKFPGTVNLKALSDGGYFLDSSNHQGVYNYRRQMSNAFEMHNIKDTTSMKECISSIGQDKWKCFFPQYSSKYVKTPLFVSNSINDRWSVHNILGLSCERNNCTIKNAEKPTVDRYKKEFLDSVKGMLTSKQNGAFLSFCFTHTMCFHDDYYTGLKITGSSLNQVVPRWFFDKNTRGDQTFIEEDDGKTLCP